MKQQSCSLEVDTSALKQSLVRHSVFGYNGDARGGLAMLSDKEVTAVDNTAQWSPLRPGE